MADGGVAGGDFRGKLKITIPREPDGMRPWAQRYEITEWERQRIKEQERERESPRASER